jgi:transcriptional regulator with XRE-family HTH domain
MLKFQDPRRSYNQILGGNIARWRTYRGYTQAQLSNALGIMDNTTISRYENGVIEMPVYRLAEICHILGVPVETIMPKMELFDGAA